MAGPRSHKFLQVLYAFLFLAFRRPVSAVTNWPILAPAAGDDVPVGEPYTIRWTDQSAGPVSITLNYDDQPIVITSSTDNNGSFTWTPASVLAGDKDYYLSICDLNLDSSECSVTSDGRFHIRDSEAQTTSSTTTSSTATSTMTSSTSSSTAPAQTTPTDSGSSSGLSTPGVVGLSIGTTVAILVLAAVGFWLYRRNQKKKKMANGQLATQTSAPPVTQQYYQGEHYKPDRYANAGPMQYHGPYVSPSELTSERPPGELDAERSVYELGPNTPR